MNKAELTLPIVSPVVGSDLVPWREQYRREMNSQIVHDSFHSRAGWTESFLLHSAGREVGYGAVLIGGPWVGTRTIFEFYLAPPDRSQAFACFSALLATSGATHVRAQTNDSLLSVMLHAFAPRVKSEKIVFHDGGPTTLPSHGAEVRRSVSDPGEWCVDLRGEVVASGGIMLHYNPPYADIYMQVAEPFRRRGFGSYLAQELKQLCYADGYIPCARCDPGNVASRGALQKAGFVPFAHILSGPISGEEDDASA